MQIIKQLLKLSMTKIPTTKEVIRLDSNSLSSFRF